MTWRRRFAFGPLRYEVEADDAVPVLPWCARHACDREGPATTVRVTVASRETPSGEGDFADIGYAARWSREGHAVSVEPAMAFRWGSALALLIAQDAPGSGALVIHGAAVRVEAGVALLLAKSGTGKSTFAARHRARSFAHNAVLVASRDDARFEAWALPFAGDPRPELDADGSAGVRAVCVLERGADPGFEWISRGAATIALARAVVRAPVHDLWARERFVLGSRLAERARAGRLRTTRGPDDLDPLDRSLTCMEYLG